MEKKKCSRCKRRKALSEFNKGGQTFCRDCNREYQREYRKKNPDYWRRYEAKRRTKSQVRQRNARRRALERNASGEATAQQIAARFAYYGNRCIMCGTTDKLTVDHLIPLSRGGANWPSNMAPMCHRCNCQKGSRTIQEFRDGK